MGAPRPFPTSTENSTRLSYDNGHIQKIPSKSDTTPRPSIAPSYKPHNSSRNNNRTDSLYTDRDKDLIHKRFLQLFNNTDLLDSDIPWLSSTNVTNDYSSLYEIPLPSKVHFVFKTSTPWKFYLSAPTIISFVLIVVKIYLCCYRLNRKVNMSQRRLSEERTSSVLDTDPQPQNDTDPPPNTASIPAIIINPEISTQDNALSDSPPSYTQCAVKNIGTVNKNVDNTFEELPPPYSICIGSFNSTDEIAKVHEGYRIEEGQSYTETDIHVNNLDFTDRTNIERYDCTIVPLSRVVETAIDIDDCNNVIANSKKTDDKNASS